MGESYSTRATGALLALVIAAAIALPSAYGAEPPAAPTAQPSATAPAPMVSTRTTWNFDSDRDYQPAPGWTVVEGPWTVVRDLSAPSQPNVYGLTWVHFWNSLGRMIGYYPIAIVNDPTEYSDFTLKADYKLNGGAFDSSGGILFRYTDQRNYYYLAAIVPGQRFELWKVHNGAFTRLASAPAQFDRQKWYEIKVEAQGSSLTCYLAGKRMFEAHDTTFSKGRYGLWGHSDSTARFDDIVMSPLATAAK